MEDINSLDAKKVCPHCQKEISIKATRCPYCQSDLRNWPNRHPIFAFILFLFGAFLVLGVIGSFFDSSDTDSSTPNTAVSTSTTASSTTPTQDDTQPIEQASPQAQIAPVVSSSKSTPLSLAIQNYSDSTASNVDVLATITQLVPEDSSGVTASFGNTIIVKDGIYSAAVHEIDSSDFQNLAVGDWVEIQGGYMQEPENNMVQIVRTTSVTVQLPASENP